MDIREEVRQFLATRRARLSPEQAGVQTFGGRRRVPGLRREEVAQLAGVSTEYFTRLEKGNLRGVSDGVLAAVARALQLDEIETAHLFDLARAANGPRERTSRRPAQQVVRPSVQRLLDSVTGAAAFLRNGRLDILATNPLGRALYAPVLDDPRRPANLARFIYLTPERAAAFYRDWEGIALDAVGSLRAEAGRTPDDPELARLVAELSLHSEPFRVRWAAHDVRAYRTGIQRFHHPVVGDLDLGFDVLELVTDPGQFLVAYTAESGSPSAEKLDLLASWSASVTRETAAPDRRRPPGPSADGGDTAESAAAGR
ncbi:helix-turn-helix domain-containing protein [Georgenia ruanii]|uniref:Helix-turn-helix domain-containing protein n=1 Tax=Georgenia ruanii TaxID=348442 RepID=A0A7J9UX11_9MICO|nr:helix-turn-helix transcriptional regulator [Georgenia ruanii]MPV89157.1 helix-turn-helix domain-containing protein [Georgenia ruanii]